MTDILVRETETKRRQESGEEWGERAGREKTYKRIKRDNEVRVENTAHTFKATN
jgi:hypothetical protein